MAANKRKVNVTTVGFTPTSGSLISVSHVQSVENPENGQTIAGRGDNAIYPTHKAFVGSDPKFTVNHQDHAAHQTLTIGAKGAFTYTIKDAGGDVAGDVVVTAALALIGDKTRGGQHQQYSGMTLVIETWSSDGVTSPVAYT